MAFVKAGLLGFGGSGKTATALLMALGLAKLHGKKKAVAMFDTETGSDFLIPIFEREGIKFLVVKSRSFKDLLTFQQEAADAADATVIDSITHVWKELCLAYEKKLRRTQGLTFRDWGPIKNEWQGFTDNYVNSKQHSIICGRAGWEWDFEESDGRKELVKTGIKMKAEGEIGFEPSLLVEMQRVAKGDIDPSDASTHGWYNRATVLKDRAQVLNGVAVDFGGTPGKPLEWEPVLKFLKPHLDFLNIGGEHLGVDTTSNSEGLFESPESLGERRKQVDIVLELIPDVFVEAGLGGTSAVAKKAQVKLLKECFGTSSWTAITQMRLEELQAGHKKLVELAALEMDKALADKEAK